MESKKNINDINLPSLKERRSRVVTQHNVEVASTKPVVYGYTRVSTTMQAEDGISLSAQKLRITQFCEFHRLTTNADDIEWYSDEGISGKNLEDRPAITELLSKIKKGDTLVIADVSRLGRSTIDVITINNRFKMEGITLRIINPDIDCSSAIGELILTMMSTLGKFERDQTCYRISSSMQAKIREGTMIRRPVFGTKVVTDANGINSVVEDPEQQKVIDLIASYILAEPMIKVAKIVRMLKSADIKIGKCKDIHHATVKKIIDRNHLRDIVAEEYVEKE